MTREEQRTRKAQQERMRQVDRRHKEAARGQMDLPFLILTLLLTVIGLIMLFSASFPRAYYDTGDGTYYFKRPPSRRWVLWPCSWSARSTTSAGAARDGCWWGLRCFC